jgi:hypothetical protein
MDIRPLDSQDTPLLEAFLLPRRDSSMFLRANAKRGGLEHSEDTPEQTFVAAFQDGEIVGVVAQGVRAHELTDPLVRACLVADPAPPG